MHSNALNIILLIKMFYKKKKTLLKNIIKRKKNAVHMKLIFILERKY